MMNGKDRRNLAIGLAFLAPNILGFFVFTFLPLLMSMVLAFSNGDMRMHNRFRGESLRFAGLDNFARLFHDVDFWRYLGNTFFMMLSIPFGIAASLGAAMLLHRETGAGRKRTTLALITVFAAILMLGLILMQGSTLALLVSGLTCGIAILGAMGGMSVYRTLFYIPSFTSGVAIYLLWTKLYNPQVGPINSTLRPILELTASTVNRLPAAAMEWGSLLLIVAAIGLLWLGARRLHQMWNDGDLGTAAGVLLLPFLAIPAGIAPVVLSWRIAWGILVTATIVILCFHAARAAKERHFPARAFTGMGSGFMLAISSVVGQLVLLGLSVCVFELPPRASDGLTPPAWLSEYHFAKPAIMIVALWAAIGSNNMLLYLAALSNVPEDLYEAAELDGAGKFARFWNITWPQLAPTTFFIVIISVIGGLQGGFDAARSMTNGGPAGSTTTLSYYIYSEGFQGGHMGYASSVAWMMFLFILVITLFNWRFGSQYVND